MSRRNVKIIHQSVHDFSISDAILKICANKLQSRSADLLQRRGGKLVVYANDTIGNAIGASGFYEWIELETIFNFLKPLHQIFKTSIALDVGANIGNHSIYFSRYFREVRAFEPHPVTNRILEINANFYSGITVHKFALSDRHGRAQLIENPVNLGGSRIADTSSTSIAISLQKLDDLDIDRSRISLIKLDVEGHEANVLRGGLETLQEAMPIVLFEAHAADFEGPMEEVEQLKTLGYRFAWIQPIGTGLEKYIRLLSMLARRKKTRSICTGNTIPPADHSMIVAIPPRWQAPLGLC